MVSAVPCATLLWHMSRLSYCCKHAMEITSFVTLLLWCLSSSPPIVWFLAVLAISLARMVPSAAVVLLSFFVTWQKFMAGLTPEALGLVPHAHAYISPAATLPGDIRYLHIAQEAEFSIGVFVLPPGACIPLHDHPNM